MQWAFKQPAIIKARDRKKLIQQWLKRHYDDVYNNDSLLITPEVCNTTIQQKLQQYMSEKSSIAKEEGIKFLEENKKRAGVVTLPSGLQYEIIKEGTRPHSESNRYGKSTLCRLSHRW